MKSYPEPEGRIWEVVENILFWIVALGILTGVCFALYFARNILEGV